VFSLSVGPRERENVARSYCHIFWDTLISIRKKFYQNYEIYENKFHAPRQSARKQSGTGSETGIRTSKNCVTAPVSNKKNENGLKKQNFRT
jgi:hypothetical protein